MQQHDSHSAAGATFHQILAREDWQNQTITHLQPFTGPPDFRQLARYRRGAEKPALGVPPPA
ncbi:beta-galactosidase [Klebsiella michiganensis]|uniref:Beta-galactosidase n=1 Tax=Klebsiella michiganensis TaxID=1134687 RepID=A0A7H4MYG1_9ENTR|nr:beta-galactosidase [Klebsiella michiganensis]